jgi:hypothetical protein
MSEEVLDLGDLQPIKKAVTFGGKNYVIREASADTARQYRNMATAGYKLADGKLTGISGVADCELFLVRSCTFEANGEANDRPVTDGQVKAWPDRITKRLFTEIRRLSPSLSEHTKESVAKQIAELQELLANMDGGDAKNAKGAGMDTSA